VIDFAIQKRDVRHMKRTLIALGSQVDMDDVHG